MKKINENVRNHIAGTAFVLLGAIGFVIMANWLPARVFADTGDTVLAQDTAILLYVLCVALAAVVVERVLSTRQIIKLNGGIWKRGR